MTGQTDASGATTLPNIILGRHNARVGKPGFSTKNLTVDVTEGDGAQTVPVALFPSAAISGIVLQDDAKNQASWLTWHDGRPQSEVEAVLRRAFLVSEERARKLSGPWAQHPLLALAREAGEAVGFDVLFGAKAQLLLHLDLDPQPLTVETVLVAQLPAYRGLISLIDVFIGPSPGVVHAHRVIGRDRTVQEGPLGLTSI
jgi:hypothetical protein